MVSRDGKLEVRNRVPGLADTIGNAETSESVPRKTKTGIAGGFFFNPRYMVKMSRLVLRQRVRVAFNVEKEGLGLNAKKILQKD